MRDKDRMTIDEPRRFRVFDWGEAERSFDTSTEVLNYVSTWEVGRETIYDGGRIVTREQVKAEIGRASP